MTVKIKGKDNYVRISDDRSYTQTEHVRVAESSLNRKLGIKEVVHHKDEDKSNNIPDNLMIFRSTGDHNLHHSKIPHEIIKTKDGSYVAIKDQRPCNNCGRLFEPDHYKQFYCSTDCSDVSRNSSTIRPSKEILEQIIFTKPSSEIAKDFGVSDRAVGKWCEKYGIEKPPRGYWWNKKY